MAKTSLPTIALLEYDALRHRVAGMLEAGMARARALLDKEKAKTYWEVGRLLNEQLEGRAGYGDSMVKRLADDLGVNRAILYRCRRFHRRMPKVAAWQQLSWSHCRALITITDDATLDELLARSAKERWTVRQLEAHIRDRVPPREARPESGTATPVAVRPVVAALQPRRGELLTYRLVNSTGLAGDGELALDLGFRVRRPLAEMGLGGKQARKVARAALAAEDTVTLVEGKSGPKLRPAAVGRERLFTFAAALGRVIDGDTLEVELSLGLGVRIVQKVRLRGIDTAELGTVAGERARAFVEDRLGGASPVVVKTFRPDKYDRYLADIFYLAGASDPRVVAAEGAFLNGELLQEELATVYS